MGEKTPNKPDSKGRINSLPSGGKIHLCLALDQDSQPPFYWHFRTGSFFFCGEGGCPVCRRMFSSSCGLYPWDASSTTLPSGEDQWCLRQSDVSPEEQDSPHWRPLAQTLLLRGGGWERLKRGIYRVICERRNLMKGRETQVWSRWHCP